MSKLVIVVPAGRRRCGRALLLGSDGSTRAGPLRVLATASGWAAKRHDNEARDWRKPFGHTPTGSYLVAGSLPPGVAPHPRRWRRFGMLGALVLQPAGGDALEAAKAGRRRFLVHGGPEDRRGRLRPTFGGLRLSDSDLNVLLRAVNDANAARDPVSTVELLEAATSFWSEGRRRDRAGRLRPSFLPPRPRRGARAKVPVRHAALIALGFGIAGSSLARRGGATVDRLARRDFVGLALLTLGALGASACSAPDAPAPDPTLPWVPAVPTVDPNAPDPPDGGVDDDGGGPNGGYGGPCPGDDGSGDDGSGDDGTGSGDTGDDSSGGGGTG
ncbi:MAG TPA: hypothetical protein VGG39_32920 [Polyangiaceae bacterium]|jgi:hypothetical protein